MHGLEDLEAPHKCCVGVVHDNIDWLHA
eukprot:COSAG02_NODE_13211_length_1426_cov_0.863602_1_plen_27_part_10